MMRSTTRLRAGGRAPLGCGGSKDYEELEGAIPFEPAAAQRGHSRAR